MNPEYYRYLPPDPPEWQWRCPVEIPTPNPFDPDECGEPTALGQILCGPHQRVLSDDEQLRYEADYADEVA